MSEFFTWLYSTCTTVMQMKVSDFKTRTTFFSCLLVEGENILLTSKLTMSGLPKMSFANFWSILRHLKPLKLCVEKCKLVKKMLIILINLWLTALNLFGDR